jgi:hypothetical protein
VDAGDWTLGRITRVRQTFWRDVMSSASAGCRHAFSTGAGSAATDGARFSRPWIDSSLDGASQDGAEAD